MANKTASLRTPSPKVRIRSQSFDSPTPRISVTPLEESPFSKSTGSIATKSCRSSQGSKHGGVSSVDTLHQLHAKWSDESILSAASSATSSVESIESSLPSCEPEHPHPMAFAQTIAHEAPIANHHPSPFLYQDTSYTMYSPWLVKAVLDLCDVHGLDWTSIATPVERIWGVKTCAAEVLDILRSNGRVAHRRWWD